MSGFYADPSSCTHYFICVGGRSFGVDCATGLHFNAATKYCDWPQNARCHVQQQSVVTPARTTHAPITPPPTHTTRPYFYMTTQPPVPTTQAHQIPNMGMFGLMMKIIDRQFIPLFIFSLFFNFYVSTCMFYLNAIIYLIQDISNLNTTNNI